jgi:hypothetical protein
VEAPTALRVKDAPNWAELRFGVQEDEFEMRILHDVLGCEHVGVSYLRFGPGWRSSVGHRHPAGGEIYVLVEGTVRMKIEDEILTLEAPSACASLASTSGRYDHWETRQPYSSWPVIRSMTPTTRRSLRTSGFRTSSDVDAYPAWPKWESWESLILERGIERLPYALGTKRTDGG